MTITLTWPWIITIILALITFAVAYKETREPDPLGLSHALGCFILLVGTVLILAIWVVYLAFSK